MPDVNVFDTITITEYVRDSGISVAVAITLPNLTINTAARTGCSVEVILPSLEMVAYSGATVTLELPLLTADANAVVGSICTVDIELPKLIISGIATTPVLCSVIIELPKLILRATSIHDILVTAAIILPLLQASISTSSSGAVTGYAINLKTLGLSEYANFTFNSMCRIGNLSFGASDSGLYRLDSGEDSGENIVAYATFPLCDFGIDNKKRVRSVYYGGTASKPLRLYTENDEGNERRRLFEPKTVRSKTKIPVGREGKGSYWKFKIINVRGADFEIDTLEMFPIVLGRV